MLPFIMIIFYSVTSLKVRTKCDAILHLAILLHWDKPPYGSEFRNEWSCTSAPSAYLLGLQTDNWFFFILLLYFVFSHDMTSYLHLWFRSFATDLVNVVHRHVNCLYRDQSRPRSALWMTPYGTVRLGHTVASRWLCPHTLQFSRQVATRRMEWLKERHILR
jgi:hypothetical protein